MSRQRHTRILLASASPRRRRLLTWLGTPFDVSATEIAEDLARDGDPRTLARGISAEKAVAAAETRLSAPNGGGDARPSELILACDTIVVLDGEVLGKPRDVEDAHRMLRALSGRTHEVVTGVALLPRRDRAPVTFAVTTRVSMKPLTERGIAEWSAKGELLGCAGAYNIESHLATVDAGECFQNVAGLPLCHLWRLLAGGRFGVLEGLRPPLAECERSRCVECALGAELTA